MSLQGGFELQSARQHYYDRSAAGLTLTYGDTVAPHAETVRWSYTTPSNRAAMLGGLALSVLRVSAAGTAGIVLIRAKYRVASAGLSYYDTVPLLDNNVGAHNQLAVTLSFVMQVGDIIELLTSDASTTGTVEYDGSLHGVEYAV